MNTVGSDKRLHYYRLTPEQTIAELQSHAMGLTNAEAERRYQEHGPNELARLRPEPSAGVFLGQFRTLPLLILLLGTAFALYLNDGRTAAILLAVALLNAIVGYLYAYKPMTLISRLEALVPSKAKVVRNGTVQEIAATHLVIGDIVAIEEGDIVPADVRIIDEHELATNEAALIGGSNSTRKFAHAVGTAVPLAARQNLGYMGTTVTNGTAHGIVIATGMHTELGRVASLNQTIQNNPSPIEQAMDNLGLRIAQGALVLVAITAIVALQTDSWLKATLAFAIGIAATVVPSGLVVEASIILNHAAGLLAKSHVRIRRLSAVATLGATDIILIDKTGLLTEYEVSTAHLLIGRTMYHTAGKGYEPKGSIAAANGKRLTSDELKHMSLFFAGSALACNARVCPPDARHHAWYVLGNPAEGAIITMARRAGIHTEALDITYPKVKEFPFDTGRQLMSSVREYDGELIVFVQGTPQVVMERCKKIWDHAHVRNFTKGDRVFFGDYLKQEANAARSTVAVAYRVMPKNTIRTNLTMHDAEQSLTFLGIISREEPLRAGVPATMGTARSEDVSVAIITDDDPVIARAIAAQAQVAVSADDLVVVTSNDLASLSDTQILQLIESGTAIFCQATTEDKLRLVEIAKSSGHTVAVTGSGINDTPALQRADIGVAIGRTNTGILKTVTELTLLNDSFSTLVKAIERGRSAFVNVRNAAVCALTDNAAELVAIFLSFGGQVFFHLPVAITAIQILAINVIIQILPIASLGRDKVSHGRPRWPGDSITSPRAIRKFLLFGFLAAAAAYANFLLFFVRAGLSAAYIDPGNNLAVQAGSLAFLTLILCQFVNIFFVRADAHARFFSSYLWSNTRLLGAFAISLLLVFAIIYIPQLQQFFGTVALNLGDWLMAALATGAYFGLRLLQRHTRQHARHEVVKLHHDVYGQDAQVQI